jgi:hypothetical protein
VAPSPSMAGRLDRSPDPNTVTNANSPSNLAWKNMRSISKSVQPYGQPATQTPRSLLGIYQNQVTEGAVQTGGDPSAPVQGNPFTPYSGPEQRHTWRSAENNNDQLINRDRHGYMQTGTERAGRISSMVDPLASGPPRPDFRAVNITVNYEAGEGARYADDLTRPYTWLGPQESGWSDVYGGSVGFYRNGPGGPPSNPPVDGPQRVWAGPPHGYHTYYPPDGQQTLAVRLNRASMVGTRVDRLSNSMVGGQNYSQTTAQQGQRT